MDISFLLPTARAVTNPEVLAACIRGINVQHVDLNIEILVYSREEVKGDNVKWIKEDGVKGPIYGFNNLAHWIAKSDYMVCITDDHLMVNPATKTINHIEDNMKDRKYKIGGLMPMACPYCIMPSKGQILGDLPIEEVMPPAALLRFPVLRRDTFNLLGEHIFHPDLFYHAGDIWLGYFLHVMGEPSAEGPTKIKGISDLKNSEHEVNDCKIVYSLIKKHLNGYTNYI
jgi:hypothetical protein|tara:strand:- start:2581 stop:3264 length:684 start_codon:yes stop_codon:yes gene_type:complete